MPAALARDPRRRIALLKARAQYARNRKMRTLSLDPKLEVASVPRSPAKSSLVDFGPKRKHSAFLKEQELKFWIEDRVGTPHISELQPDDDVSSQLDVEELSVGGEMASLIAPGEMIEDQAKGSNEGVFNGVGNFS